MFRGGVPLARNVCLPLVMSFAFRSELLWIRVTRYSFGDFASDRTKPSGAQQQSSKRGNPSGDAPSTQTFLGTTSDAAGGNLADVLLRRAGKDPKRVGFTFLTYRSGETPDAEDLTYGDLL